MHVRRNALVLALLGSCAPIFAWAEPEDAAYEVAGVTVTAHRDSYGFERSTSAMKTDTALRDIPQSISVIGRDLIDDQAMQSMADLVRYVPGVSMGQGEGHRDAPTLRGNASTADFFVDGVRDDAQYFRDLYNAERIEVLKGPNAMIFGRGGGGGVINRVSKSSGPMAGGEVRLEGGSHDHLRVTADGNLPLTDALSGRLNLLWEESDSFRDQVSLSRRGISPTLTYQPSDRLTLKARVEHFEDERTVDRGVPSLNGRPLETDRATFFGSPDQSPATTKVKSAAIEARQEIGQDLTVRAHLSWSHYAKAYQNLYPGLVLPATSQVQILAYSNPSERENLFAQADLVWTGGRHTLLAGVELGSQITDTYRETGYFGGSSTIFLTSLASPTLTSAPVTFRQSATDADNRARARVQAVFLQDQIQLTDQIQLVAGLRFDRFELKVDNHRNGTRLSRKDELVSPRLGLIYRPIEPVSVYASYSVSALPASGDQFSNLTLTSAALKPEAFTNLEVGVKWDLTPDLVVTAAAYELDRENSTSRDPFNPAVTLQTGAQRSRGLELGVTGNITPNWSVAGGLARQDAEVTEATLAAAAGKKVPLVPRSTASLWNRYQVTPDLGFGLGVIHQTSTFAAIDNAVTLPGFTRLDAAVFYNLSPEVSLQLNVENLSDVGYFPTAHNNSNISPGAPRTARLSVTARF
jgi:catecholate siderophore receptor